MQCKRGLGGGDKQHGVIPAKAGIQGKQALNWWSLDPGFRRCDGNKSWALLACPRNAPLAGNRSMGSRCVQIAPEHAKQRIGGR